VARRRRPAEEHEEHVDEAWLVSYADMMTLLVALFMVLFSISSVNTSKFESLQRSLQAAFSGKIFPGGRALQQTGGQDEVTSAGLSPSQPSFAPSPPVVREGTRKAEDQHMEQLRRRVQRAAAELGLQSKVQARVTKDGLRIRVLSDDLLFDSGQATPKPPSFPLLARLGDILRREAPRPVIVEGHTDPVPTAGSAFATNWELSAARATQIVRAFSRTGVAPRRLTASGRAYLDPIASNDTAAGRSVNRRVEVLLPRMATR
jgi:chemotaxis protein MotB